VSSNSKPPPANRDEPTSSWQFQRTAAVAGVLSLIIDIASKTWARHNLTVGESVAFIPAVLKLSLVTNTGAAFSVGSGNGMIVLTIASAVFLLLIFWYYQRLKKGFESGLEEYGLSIVIGAAAGNLLDRLLYGRVTDFLEFTFISFPVFNVADIMIDVGIGLIIISTLRQPRLPLDGKSAERQ